MNRFLKDKTRIIKSIALAFFIFLSTNTTLITLIYFQYKINMEAELKDTALNAVKMLDKLFSYASSANQYALTQTNLSCQELSSKTKIAELETPFVSHIAIYWKLKPHCDKHHNNEPYIPRSINSLNNITLLKPPGETSSIILFKSEREDFTAISFINYTYIKMALNVAGNGKEMHFTPNKTQSNENTMVTSEVVFYRADVFTSHSDKYGFSIRVSTPENVSERVLFLSSNKLILLCGTTLSLFLGFLSGFYFNRNVSIINEIMKGIINKEFVPHYQPIINAHTGGIEGVEILMRWQHPEKGLLYPSEFISHAESAGLIIKMTEQVMTLSNTSLLSKIELLPSNFKINVNVIPMHIQDESFASLCKCFLDLFENWELGIEITESMLLENSEELQVKLKKIPSDRLTLALDDFGTGYSNLKSLQSLPFKTIKIDKSFVSEIGVDAKTESIIESTIHLAQSMNMTIVAEGVENEVQANYLIIRGVDFLQGYLYGKPMDLASLLDLFSKERKNYTTMKNVDTPNT